MGREKRGREGQLLQSTRSGVWVHRRWWLRFLNWEVNSMASFLHFGRKWLWMGRNRTAGGGSCKRAWGGADTDTVRHTPLFSLESFTIPQLLWCHRLWARWGCKQQKQKGKSSDQGITLGIWTRKKGNEPWAWYLLSIMCRLLVDIVVLVDWPIRLCTVA